MQLPGRLRLTTLGDVLGALHRSQASGVLELSEDRGVTHRVYWTQGMITQIQTDLYRQRLGDLLAGQGFLGARALARLARRLLESPSRRAGEILIEEGFANGDLVSAGLRRQLRHKLDALFQIKDAQLAFRIPRPHDAHQVPLAPGEFLHGRPRARPRARTPEAPPPRASSSGSSRARTSQPAPHGARSRAYATLGLLPGADRSAIQQAFRRLALRLHPDRFPNADPSERARLLSRFAELSAAYHALAG
ncbi:MAG TPA: J domain-containing protein [Polyangiaceae bacterium]|nr:J domain-containing protein [Polyangiaceae bacterium]